LGVPATARAALLWITPLLLSLHVALAQPFPLRTQPRWTDVQSLARLLHEEWRWDWPSVTRALHSPDKARLLDDLAAAVPGWDTAPRRAPRTPPQPLMLVAVETRRLPDALPEGWIIVSRHPLQVLLAVPLRSHLDWDAQVICAEDQRGAETCTGPPAEPGRLAELRARAAEIRRFVRCLPWRAEGAVEAIVMPDIPFTCRGRIAQGPPQTEIDASRRAARISQPGQVCLEWTPNTPDCALWDFLKLDEPPFVIAGDPYTVETVSGLIHRDRTR
jgi:hypothetical protein